MRYLIVCTFALAACAAEPEPGPELGSQAQASTAITITPSVASGGSDTATPQSAHYTYTGGSGAGSGWLVVFLHGVGGTPSGYQTYMEHANALGFHVIGLSYWDTGDYGTPRIENICNIGTLTQTQQSACWGDVRHNMWDGTAVPNFSFPTHPTVKARLDDVLDYLDATYTGWSQFRESGHPKWSKIVIAGHSMGAGVAAWIATQKPVHRLVMMSQPQDYVDDGSGGTIPAAWISAGFSSLTPDAMFGLSHVNDTVSDYGRTMTNWSTFGMSGLYCITSGCINTVCSPLLGQYCGARRLRATNGLIDPHNDIAQNEAFFGAAWTYMLTRNL